jgi:type II secretory pathway pseudopilin PulG
MEMVAIMATIILIATTATLIFAFAAYFITRAKRKKSKTIQLSGIDESQKIRRYFERYIPGGRSIIEERFSNRKGEESSQWT